MFSLFRSAPPLVEETPLSRFVREAPSEEKRRVYANVISKASTEQRQLMASAEVIRHSRARRQAA
jgi:hypothetical protein